MTIDPYTFDFEISTGKLGSVEIELNEKNNYLVKVNGERWLSYDPVGKLTAAEFISHYTLAQGDVIVTGMGMGLREQLLLQNPNIKSIKIVELSEDLIEFHRQHSKWIHDPRITVVNTDANSYKDTCDVLLLDHYEQERFIDIVKSVRAVAENIQSSVLWFWPLEHVIVRRASKRHSTLTESYRSLKEDIQVPRLPELDRDQLREFCRAHSRRLLPYHYS